MPRQPTPATDAAATVRRLTQTMGQLAEVQLQLDGERLRRQDSDALFERVFSGMSDAVLLVDARGRVARCNRAAVRMTAHALSALLGLTPRDIFGAEVPATAAELFRRAERGVLEGVNSHIKRAGGETLAVSVSCAVVHDAHDKVVGAVYCARDATELRSAERQREAQLAVTGALAASSTVREALPKLLAALGTTLDWDQAGGWLADRETGVLRRSALWQHGDAVHGSAQLEVHATAQLRTPRDRALRAAWKRELTSWEQCDGHADGGDTAQPRWQTTVCAPIWAGEQIAGVLEFHSLRARSRDDRLLELLSALGAQIGNFIERTRAEEALDRIELFRTAFESAPVGMALFGSSGEDRGRLLQANAALCAFLARPEKELIGQRLHHLSHAEDRDADLAAAARVLEGQVSTSVIEARYLRPEGQVVWGIVHRTILRDGAGNALYGVVQVQDITERKQAEDQLAHQALHDPLTGLPNRALFLDRVGHALVRTQRDARSRPAVMFIDLDRFKVVNDSLGHTAGDAILVEAAWRIESVVRSGDTVARLGGDEFTVLCEGAGHVDATAVATRIVEAVAVPFTVQGRDVYVSASIGIALSGGPADSPELLIRDADAAMYRAKGAGGGTHAVFRQAMLGSPVKRMELESALRHAIDHQELCLFYQPQVSLTTDVVVGFEALARWRHPTRGLIAPGEFIPLAEETGLIVPIGAWVIREACREARRWRNRNDDGRALKLSVNISPRQLSEAGLVDLVAATLAETGTRPEELWLEITESVVMDEGVSALELLNDLKDLGVGLAIDDFGIGFSSLSRLRELPRVDAVKLDKAFIDGVCNTSSDRAIVAAGINLAHALEAVTVAEGVETAEQTTALRELGCELAQGYFFARPKPPDELAELLTGTTVSSQRAAQAAPTGKPPSMNARTARSAPTPISDAGG